MSVEQFPLPQPARPSSSDRLSGARTTLVLEPPADLAANTIHWLLRIACVCEFIGHGAFGIITKAAWVPYFGFVGISPSVAYMLMPIIGMIDISLGLLVL